MGEEGAVDRELFDRLSRLVGTASSRREVLRAVMVGTTLGSLNRLGGGSARGRRGAEEGKRRAATAPSCSGGCTRSCDDRPLHGGANLARCDLKGRDLDGLKLNGSNLSGACFDGASLRGTDLRGANVARACFRGADLTGADIRGSNVTARQLACATVGCTTLLPNGKPAVRCDHGETCCDGQCVDLDADLDNCTECGNTCPQALPNATVVCGEVLDEHDNRALGCGFVCETGFANCSGDPFTGCEQHVSNDPNNCGACGFICPSDSPRCCGCRCFAADTTICSTCQAVGNARLIRRR